MPAVTQARGSARTFEQIGSWPASQHFADLNLRIWQWMVPDGAPSTEGLSREEAQHLARQLVQQRLGPLCDPNNSGYDIGWDGVQLTAARNNTTYIGEFR